jgi:polyisoprenoid-binding protein YceI
LLATPLPPLERLAFVLPKLWSGAGLRIERQGSMNRKRVVELAAVLAWGLARVATAQSAEVFVVNEERSAVRVHVGKSGAFSFAGHRHVVAAPVTGSITADSGNIGASSVELTFPTARFRVLPDGEPAGDPPKVEEVMRGPRVLESTLFPEARFRSKRVTGSATSSGVGEYEVQVTGDLTIHGATREVVVPMSVRVEGDTLTAKGKSTIRHDQFGLTPVTAAGGTVRVSNEIDIDFQIVAARRR